MSSINQEIAEKVLRSIFADGGRGHNQTNWLHVPNDPESTHTLDAQSMASGHFCGTRACIAGWAALHAGWKVEVSRDPESPRGRRLSLFSPSGDRVEEGVVELDLLLEGQRALGLNDLDASTLFYTMDEREAVARLYSLLRTGDTLGLLVNKDGVEYTYEAHTNFVNEVYRQAEAEFSPVLDVLDTLEEPVEAVTF